MAYISTLVWDHTDGESPANMQIPADDAISVVNAQTVIGAMNAVSIGTFGRQEIVIKTPVANGSQVRPASALAQKENRYRVGFQDLTTLKYGSFTIPAADLTLLPAGSEFLDLTAGVGLAIKTNVDLYGRSDIGNAIAVYEVRFVVI